MSHLAFRRGYRQGQNDTLRELNELMGILEECPLEEPGWKRCINRVYQFVRSKRDKFN